MRPWGTETPRLSMLPRGQPPVPPLPPETVTCADAVEVDRLPLPLMLNVAAPFAALEVALSVRVLEPPAVMLEGWNDPVTPLGRLAADSVMLWVAARTAAVATEKVVLEPAD